MGNRVGVDRHPVAFSELFSGSCNESQQNVHMFREFVFVWIVSQTRDQLIAYSPFNFANSLFERHSCYIAIHVQPDVLQTTEFDAETKPKDKEIRKLSYMVQDWKENIMDENSNEAFSSFSSPLHSSSTIKSNSTTASKAQVNIHLWNGREASRLIRAAALASAFKLEKHFASIDNVNRLLHLREKVAASSVISIDIVDSTDDGGTLEIPLLHSLLNPSSSNKYDKDSNHHELYFHPLRPSQLFKRLRTGPGPSTTESESNIQGVESRSSGSETYENGEVSFDLSTVSTAELLKYYDPICSQIEEYLYLGGRIPSENKEILLKHKITHILNCAGVICQNLFTDDFTYKTLYLYDNSSQEISNLFWDVIQFIDDAVANNGRVYVHCHQGVSRSSAMVICYLMWKNKWSFQYTHEYVKGKRQICSPNAGFIAQLLQWSKNGRGYRGTAKCYRIAMHSPQNPEYLIPYYEKTLSSLDPKTCYLVFGQSKCFVWTGNECPLNYIESAKSILSTLQKYEFPECTEVIHISQHNEPDEFWNLFEQRPVIDSTE